MTRVFVDTSAYSLLIKGHAGIKTFMQQVEAAFVSQIVIGEVLTGAKNTDKPGKFEQHLSSFLALPQTTILEIDMETARCYAAIVSTLRKVGRPIPSNDSWIAASAMQHGLPILAADAHFNRIPQIRVEMFHPK